jgi:hypothetical protein
MAINARGRIADTGEDTSTSSLHHDYILTDEQYILADELGHEILYLLQGDSDYIGAHQSDSVEVRGAVVGTDPSGKFETLDVESIRRLSGAPQRS